MLDSLHCECSSCMSTDSTWYDNRLQRITLAIFHSVLALLSQRSTSAHNNFPQYMITEKYKCSQGNTYDKLPPSPVGPGFTGPLGERV